jgi:hypothetical protein
VYSWLNVEVRESFFLGSLADELSNVAECCHAIRIWEQFCPLVNRKWEALWKEMAGTYSAATGDVSIFTLSSFVSPMPTMPPELQIMNEIIFPQVIRNVLPSLVHELLNVSEHCRRIPISEQFCSLINRKWEALWKEMAATHSAAGADVSSFVLEIFNFAK